MKKNRWIILAFVLVMAADGFNTALADELSDTVDIFAKSDVVKPFLKNSYGYAVFPLVGKGGFVVGSSYGTGQVVAQGKVTGTAKLVKATIGLQAGGQAFSQMFFFQDKRAYDLFTSGSFELGADASAVAITAGGRHPPVPAAPASASALARLPANRRPPITTRAWPCSKAG